MKADAVVRSADALEAALNDPSIARIFAIGHSQAPLDVVLLPGGASWNRGILLRERDVVLLEGPAPVGEMLAALHASDRIACVTSGKSALLRHWVLNVIGALDATDSLPEWQERARKLGLLTKSLS